MDAGTREVGEPRPSVEGRSGREETLPQLADLVRHAAEGTVVVDGEGVVLFANPAAEALLGRGAGGAVGFTLGYPVVGDEPTVITLRRPGLDAATVEMRAAETCWDGEPAFVVNLHEISARLRDEEEKRRLQDRSEHLNQMLRAIAGVNQIIIRESNSARLIRATCERLVSDGGFEASWLVLTNEDGTLVDVAESGRAEERFSALTESFARGVVPECCRRARQERRVVRFGGAGECGACKLCSAVIPAHSVLTSCLTHGDRSFGYVTILFETPVDEDGEEARLLHTISGDLGFALHSNEVSLARTKTQRLLEETERVADVGGWEWDLATDQFTVSEEWRRIHGCGEAPLGLSDVILLSSPQDRGRWAASLESLRDGHGPIEIDHRIVRPNDGETRVVRSRSGDGEDGASTTVRGITQDITTAHEATEQIRFQARVLASVGEAVVVTGPRGTILFWNDAARKLYGWSAKEALGRKVLDVIPAPQTLEAWGDIMRHLTRGEFWSGELWVQDRDGRGFPALVTHAPVFGDDGTLEAVIGVSSDLTERVRAEEELRQVSKHLGEAVTAGKVGLWEWDLLTDQVSFSAEWKRQLGHAEDEIDDDFEEWRCRVHPEDLDRTLAEIDATVAGERELYRAEFRLRHKDGGYRSILAQATVVRREDGRAVQMVGSHVDLTDLREAEASQRAAEAQLQQSQKMESVGMLAGGVAHDFNNVLSVILGISELSLLDAELSESQRADFEEIRAAGARAADLTRQLLAFARKQPIQPQVVDLNEAVAGVINMLSRLIGEDLELIWKPGHELRPVKVDPAQVDQLLVNLAVNARDAILEGDARGGRITLETAGTELDETFCAAHPGAVAGQYVVLSVTDNGAGMDKVTLGKIFEPFFTTKAPGEGTGLGLATVYGIVKQNDGFVTADSEPGEGTTFRIYLPRLVGSDTEDGSHPNREGMAGGAETLLLVEDDAPVLGVLTRILEALGYDLLVASSPERALELVRERGEDIDLLMTDVVMPVMNGRQLAAAVRALRPEIGCLFMSGYPEDVIARRGVLEEGMNFLQKPFDAEGLATAVRRALAEE